MSILDSADPRGGANVANLEGLDDRVRVEKGDIRLADAIAPLLRDADVLVNCAAYTSHADSFRDPKAYVDVNCNGVLALLDAVRRSDRAIRFVQVGTSTQVGRMRSEPVTESHPEFPMDLYSATKTAAEKFVFVYGNAYGMPVTAVRLANVYGPRARIDTPSLGFINFFIGLALQDRDVTVYGDGAQLRCVTYVDDVVDALLLASVRDEAVGEVMFAATEERHSVRELAHAIVNAVGRGRVRTVAWPQDRAAIESGDAVISSTRAFELLGWRPRTTLIDGLAATRDYYAARLDRYI